MPKINLIIAGGREFKDYESMSTRAKEILKGYKRKDIMIISGTARGADRLGERFAREHSLHLSRMPAQWQRPDGSTNRAAGYERNVDMAKHATHLLACWDGKSRGTKHMIDIAHRHGLGVYKIIYR